MCEGVVEKRYLDGRMYRPIRRNGCDGCAGEHDDDLCARLDRCVIGAERHHVVWVEEVD